MAARRLRLHQFGALLPATVRPPSSSETCQQVREVYAALETRPVERACTRLTECCQFKLTGRTPYLTRAEAVLAARAYRATGRKRLRIPENGACPMLDPQSGRCLIYAERPFGCRTHFCAAAGGPYARREVVDLIHRLEDLSRQLGSTEALPLGAAITEALADAGTRR
jgi:Fe-S-cluster containining protein